MPVAPIHVDEVDDVAERNAIDSIAQANLQTSSGKFIPLSQVARAQFVWEPGVMWRENRDWAITVQADVKDGVQGATVTQRLDPLIDQVRASLPAGHSIEIAGAQEQSATAGKSIAVNLPLYAEPADDDETHGMEV